MGGGVYVMSIISIHIWNFGGWYISSHCYFLHIFSLGMVGLDCGWNDMAWQMCPTPREGISLKCSKTYFWSTFHSLSLSNFFQHSKVSGIEIHLKFTYPYHFYLNVTLLDVYISLHIDLFVTYFCLVISEEDTLVVK